MATPAVISLSFKFEASILMTKMIGFKKTTTQIKQTGEKEASILFAHLLAILTLRKIISFCESYAGTVLV